MFNGKKITMENTQALISFRNADIRGGENTVIYGLDMDIFPGDFVYIVGKVGTGKTSIIRTVTAENRLLSDLNQTVQVSGKRATVTAKLVRGVKYQFVFWAQKPGQFAISDANLTIPANKLSTMMNNDAFDAFYAFKAVDPKQEDFSADVTLYRPFAQINVGASAADIAVAQDNKVDVAGNLKTFYTIKGVKNTLNLLTGAVSGSVSRVRRGAGGRRTSPRAGAAGGRCVQR